MASLFEPVPTVAPQTNAAPGMGIQARSEAFGSDVARATSGFGEAVQHASGIGMDALIARQKMDNEIHSSELNTWLADKVTDRFGEYAKLEGRAAQDALPQFKDDVNGLYQEHMNQAGSLQERTLLAKNGRYLTTQYYRYAQMHADRQWRTWADKTATDRAASYGAQAGMAATNNDDAGMQIALNTSDDEVAKLYEQRGWGQQEIKVETAKNRGRNLKQIIETQAVEDPVGAVERFRKVADQMDPASRLATANHLRPLVTKIHGREIADEVLGREPPGVPQDSRSQTIMQKFQEAGYSPEQSAAVAGHLFHESGNNPNAVHDNGTGLGIAGWRLERREALQKFAASRGKPANDFDTQVDFAIHELDTTEGKAGAALKGAKSIEDATTAFMHFERPRGYTPDNPRGGDSYDARLANAIKFANGNFSGALPDKATAMRRVAERTGNNPGLQDAAFAHLNQVYRIDEATQNKTQGQFKTRVQDSLAEASNTGSVRQPLTRLDFMGAYGAENGIAAYGTYQNTLQLEADKASVATLAPADQDRLIEQREPQPGEGYAESLQSQNNLRQAVEHVRKARAADPAGFALRNLPGVSEAYRTMEAAQKDPAANEQAKKSARVDYVNTLLAAQEKIGIPEDTQAPMTRDEAVELSLPLRRMLPGQEREVLTELAKDVQERFGENAEGAFAYVLQVNKLNKETAQAAARLMKKLGLGQLDPADASGSPDARRLSQVAEVSAANEAVTSGMWEPNQVDPLSGGPVPSFRASPPQPKDKGVNVPTGAIQHLRSNPGTAAQFDKMYGPGTAKKILDKYPVR